jgi:hypothetical protein
LYTLRAGNESRGAGAQPLALPADAAGRVYLAVSAEYCDYILPGEMLPQLLASGAVQEVDAATYAALLPPEPFPA